MFRESPHKSTFKLYMETADSVVEKLGRHQLDQAVKIGMVGLDRLAWCGPLRTQHHFCDISPQNGQLNSDHEKILDRLRLRCILQKKSPLPFTNVKSLKTKNLFHIEETCLK